MSYFVMESILVDEDEFIHSNCVRYTDMDKSWMEIEDRRYPKYLDGVIEFLGFAYAHIEPREKIQRLCVKCNNVYFHTWDDVKAMICIIMV